MNKRMHSANWNFYSVFHTCRSAWPGGIFSVHLEYPEISRRTRLNAQTKIHFERTNVVKIQEKRTAHSQ